MTTARFTVEQSPLLSGRTYDVSILVTNWNGAEELRAFLNSYHAQHGADTHSELVVVDHASSDDSRNLLRRWMAKLPIKLLCCDRNQRFSVANNLAREHAQGTVLVFANNDLVFDEPLIDALREALEDPRTGLAAVPLYYPDKRGRRGAELQHGGIRFRPFVAQGFMRPLNMQEMPGRPGAPVAVAAVSAALAACRSRDFDAVNGFLPDYDYGFEDVDLAIKLRRRLGLRSVVCTRVGAVHREFGSQARQDPDLLSARRQGNLECLRARHNRYLVRQVFQSQLHHGYWHASPLRVRLPAVLTRTATQDKREARAAAEINALQEQVQGDIRLQIIDAQQDRIIRGFYGIWLIDDLAELADYPAPRGALVAGLVARGDANRWLRHRSVHRLDLLICEHVVDREKLRSASGVAVDLSTQQPSLRGAAWLDSVLALASKRLMSPSLALNLSSTATGQELEAAIALGRALRQRGYAVRLDSTAGADREDGSQRMFLCDASIVMEGSRPVPAEPDHDGELALLLEELTA